MVTPFTGGNEDAGLAAFGGLIVSAGPGRCALNIEQYVAAADPTERDAVRAYLERTQRPQGIAALRQKWEGDLPASARRTYILTTADTLVPPELQRTMAASVNAEIVEIATRSRAVPRAAPAPRRAADRRHPLTLRMARPDHLGLGVYRGWRTMPVRVWP